MVRLRLSLVDIVLVGIINDKDVTKSLAKIRWRNQELLLGQMSLNQDQCQNQSQGQMSLDAGKGMECALGRYRFDG